MQILERKEPWDEPKDCPDVLPRSAANIHDTEGWSFDKSSETDKPAAVPMGIKAQMTDYPGSPWKVVLAFPVLRVSRRLLEQLKLRRRNSLNLTNDQT